jgi:hypothetical protein
VSLLETHRHLPQSEAGTNRAGSGPHVRGCSPEKSPSRIRRANARHAHRLAVPGKRLKRVPIPEEGPHGISYSPDGRLAGK